MAEKGIKVEDADAGEIIACRDAVALEGTESRIIQLTDQAARPVPYQITTPLRSGVTSGDATLISPLPAGIAGAILEVGDASHIAMWCKITLNGVNDDECIIHVTPIIVTDEVTPTAVALLSPRRIAPVDPTRHDVQTASLAASVIRIADTSPLTIVSIIPTQGAQKLAFHIHLSSTTSVTLDLFAEPTSITAGDTIPELRVFDYKNYGGCTIKNSGGGGG